MIDKVDLTIEKMGESKEWGLRIPKGIVSGVNDDREIEVRRASFAAFTREIADYASRFEVGSKWLFKGNICTISKRASHDLYEIEMENGDLIKVESGDLEPINL